MHRITRSLGSVLLAGLITFATSGQASAGIEWCAEDPVLQIWNSQFRVTTRIAAARSDVGGVAYVVDLPRNAQGFADARFPPGYPIPTTVELRYVLPDHDGTSETFTVRVRVTASSGLSVPVEATVSGPSADPAVYLGTTNAPLSFRVAVSAR